jgi:hypothetical protein
VPGWKAILARVTISSSWAGSSMAEQLTLNQRVAGSSPARLTTWNLSKGESILPHVALLVGRMPAERNTP